MVDLGGQHAGTFEKPWHFDLLDCAGSCGTDQPAIDAQHGGLFGQQRVRDGRGMSASTSGWPV